MDAITAFKKAQKLYQKLSNRRPEIEEFDDYYAGEQKLQFASKEWADFHQNQYSQFSDNWTAVVADALNERLRVDGVLLDGDSDGYASRLWDLWRRNDLGPQSSQGFLETIIAKRSFVLVWGTPDGEPIATWEHPSQVIVDYDPASNGRVKLAALKAWVDDDTEYIYLYTAEYVWKWKRPFFHVSSGKTSAGLDVSGTSIGSGFALDGWTEHHPHEDDTWPVTNPMGRVPVVEFQNRPRLLRGPMSDIAGAKDMQDAVNLMWAYLFGAADHASLPARVVMGQQPPKIPILGKNGETIGEQDVPISELKQKRILWLTGEHTKIGEWSRADLKTFTDVIEIAVGHLGGQSRTPAHYFVANKGLSNINGETLIATETPLVKKAEEFALYSQSALREVWELLALASGDDGLVKAAQFAETQMAEMSIRSDSQRSDAMVKDRKAGYPFEYLLEKYGESPTAITRIMEMKRSEAFDPQLQELVDRVNEDVDV